MSAFNPIRLACITAVGAVLLALSGCYYYPAYYGSGYAYPSRPYRTVPAAATQREPSGDQAAQSTQATAPDDSQADDDDDQPDDDQYNQDVVPAAYPPPPPVAVMPAGGWYGWGMPAFSLNFGFGGRGYGHGYGRGYGGRGYRR